MMDLDFETMDATKDDTLYTFGPWVEATPDTATPGGLFQHVDADGTVWSVGMERYFLPNGLIPSDCSVAYRLAERKA